MSERIDYCERCGSLDHHLVEGLCPTCKPLAQSIVAKLTEESQGDSADVEGEHQANDDYAISEAICKAKRASLEWVR